MKIYLWVLHIGGLVLSVMFGFDGISGTWPIALTFGALSVVGLWAIVSLRMGGENGTDAPGER